MAKLDGPSMRSGCMETKPKQNYKVVRETEAKTISYLIPFPHHAPTMPPIHILHILLLLLFDILYDRNVFVLRIVATFLHMPRHIKWAAYARSQHKFAKWINNKWCAEISHRVDGCVVRGRMCLKIQTWFGVGPHFNLSPTPHAIISDR